MASKAKSSPRLSGLKKACTGIAGLDEITLGGLPAGRPTLICGNAGCGKTVLGMEFIVNGAAKYGEPGLFVSFEENAEELRANYASFGRGLDSLLRRKKVLIDHIAIERSEILETGAYDLEGLFVRIGYSADSIGAKRIVLDTIESLFSGFSNEVILRAELRRLFRWLKSRNLTAIVTGERGERMLTRHGLEEYVADCVILLDHDVNDRVATRRLKIVKYRGTAHGTNEYPFLIVSEGISVLPITSLGLTHKAGHERVSTGIPTLDLMLGGKGYYRGSSILVSGSPGSGKTSIVAQFLDAACRRGEKCILFNFEESAPQLIRNMGSIGLDLGKWVRKGLLEVEVTRPSSYGLEMHLATIHRRIDAAKPRCVVMDPISGFSPVGGRAEVRSMLARLVDYLKMEAVTVVLTDLIAPGEDAPPYGSGISSIADTWLVVINQPTREARERSLSIVKSRGMEHSPRVAKLAITGKGIQLGL